MVALQITAGSTVIYSEFQPVRGGQRAHFEVTGHVDFSTPDSASHGYNWIDAAGAVTAVNLPDLFFSGSEAVGIANSKTKRQSVTLPATAVGYRMYGVRPAWSGSNTFFFRRPYMGNAARGADVTSEAVPILALPPTTIIRANSAGTADAGQLPREVQARVFRGGIDVTTSTPLALSIFPSGSATATIHATSGVITITAMAGRTAELTVTPTLPGLAAGTFAAERADAPPAVSGSGGGGAASTSSLSSFDGSSYVVVATLTVTTGGSGAIALAAPLDISTTSAGSPFTVYGKTQRWNGSSWVDVSSEVSAVDMITDGEPSSITITGSASGLSPLTSIDVRLVMRTSTTTRTVNLSGTFSATGS
jgi:hypothetical protein